MSRFMGLFIDLVCFIGLSIGTGLCVEERHFGFAAFGALWALFTGACLIVERYR